jgi:hypothetical protein
MNIAVQQLRKAHRPQLQISSRRAAKPKVMNATIKTFQSLKFGPGAKVILHPSHPSDFHPTWRSFDNLPEIHLDWNSSENRPQVKILFKDSSNSGAENFYLTSYRDNSLQSFSILDVASISSLTRGAFQQITANSENTTFYLEHDMYGPLLKFEFSGVENDFSRVGKNDFSQVTISCCPRPSVPRTVRLSETFRDSLKVDSIAKLIDREKYEAYLAGQTLELKGLPVAIPGRPLNGTLRVTFPTFYEIVENPSLINCLVGEVTYSLAETTITKEIKVHLVPTYDEIVSNQYLLRCPDNTAEGSFSSLQDIDRWTNALELFKQNENNIYCWLVRSCFRSKKERGTVHAVKYFGIISGGHQIATLLVAKPNNLSEKSPPRISALYPTIYDLPDSGDSVVFSFRPTDIDEMHGERTASQARIHKVVMELVRCTSLNFSIYRSGKDLYLNYTAPLGSLRPGAGGDTVLTELKIEHLSGQPTIVGKSNSSIVLEHGVVVRLIQYPIINGVPDIRRCTVSLPVLIVLTKSPPSNVLGIKLCRIWSTQSDPNNIRTSVEKT